MNKLTRTAVGVLVAASTSLGAAQARTGVAGETDAISNVLMAYKEALNDSDVSGVMRLYAEDGVFMPQHSPSQVGADAVKAAYEQVFAAIKLSVKFDIVEIVLVAPDWAFARTNSAGTVVVRANGVKLPEANQELFVLRKQPDGAWKIARYAFSTTNPSR